MLGKNERNITIVTVVAIPEWLRLWLPLGCHAPAIVDHKCFEWGRQIAAVAAGKCCSSPYYYLCCVLTIFRIFCLVFMNYK